MRIGTATETGGMIRMPTGQGNDSFSKNIQNQIANAQKQMQELGDNKNMSLEEKMKKRQEIQQQINDLQNQLRQHQIEQRKEQQQKSGSSMDDMLEGKRQAAGKSKGGTGMSSAGMQAIVSADSSMKQVKVQGAVKSQMDGKAGVLKAEIKLDAGRGGDTQKKKEELAEVEAKSNDITSAQMKNLSEMNKELEEAAKEDQKAAQTGEKDRAEKKDKTDNTGDKDKASDIENTDVVPLVSDKEEDTLAVDVSENISAPIGSKVDVRL